MACAEGPRRRNGARSGGAEDKSEKACAEAVQKGRPAFGKHLGRMKSDFTLNTIRYAVPPRPGAHSAERLILVTDGSRRLVDWAGCGS